MRIATCTVLIDTFVHGAHRSIHTGISLLTVMFPPHHNNHDSVTHSSPLLSEILSVFDADKLYICLSFLPVS